MNIDGITAVIFCELGFEPELGRGLFVLSRSVGILAHAWEQKQRGRRIMGPMPKEIPYRYSGPPQRVAATTGNTTRRGSIRERKGLKEHHERHDREQLVKYLEARGVEHIFGLCGHTNIAVLAALEKSRKIKFVNTPARADRGARGRWLRARDQARRRCC